MSEPQGAEPARLAPPLPPAPPNTAPVLWKQRDVRRTRRRLLLAAIALTATLGAGLLFGAQRAERSAVQVPPAANTAPPASGGADPEVQPAAPAPADAPRQIVQALTGRAGAASSASGAPAAGDATPSPAADSASSDAPPAATDSDGLAPAGSPPETPAAGATVPPDPGRSYAGAAPVPRPHAPASTTTAIVWPARGPITSLFGPQHPLGIDIGIPPGTIVRAIADGRVAFAGGDACCSYGYYVDIDHGDGITTRYGHLTYVPAFTAGQVVHAGDPIGLSGSTGNSTGPHLHFEVRLNGLPVNPLLVLPR